VQVTLGDLVRGLVGHYHARMFGRRDRLFTVAEARGVGLWMYDPPFDVYNLSRDDAVKLVDHLVGRGYLTREADPRDGRAKLLVLTKRGRACTTAAEQAANDVVQRWKAQLPAHQFAEMRDALNQIAVPGRLRPAW